MRQKDWVSQDSAGNALAIAKAYLPTQACGLLCVFYSITMMQSGSLGAEEPLKMAQDRDWLVLSVKQDWSKIINSQKA
jgi:hypothetical protein